jgi:macrolide transport system ATP-binding/permease protein
MSFLLLEASNIVKYFSDRKIIDFKTFRIYSGDRIGVVGSNGSGKTTFLNLLSGELLPDSGTINHHCGISYIQQFGAGQGEVDERQWKEFGVANQLETAKMSGGEQTRIKIAKAFSSENLLILADEPTSNLDLNGVELFCQKLSQVESFILISHDRSILDRLCNKIVEVKDGAIRIYEGGYGFYKEQSELEEQQKWAEYEQYSHEKQRLRESVSERQSKEKSMRKAPKRMGNSEARLHKGKTSEKKKKLDSAASRIKGRMEQLEVKEKPRKTEKISLDFSLTHPPENKIVIRTESLSFSYGDRIIFDRASFEIPNGTKTAICGENGIGKTTLLSLIAQGQNDIYTVPKAKIGYFYQGFENIDFDKTVLQNVMSESVQNEATARTILARLLMKRDDVYKPAGILSGGERIKLSFAKLFVSDANILMLDEPTNYLDMPSIEVLQNMICEYEGTVIFVSHDREFVDSVANRMILIQNRKLVTVDGGKLI